MVLCWPRENGCALKKARAKPERGGRVLLIGVFDGDGEPVPDGSCFSLVAITVLE